MMTDMGAAAWFIIDETEKLEWATTGTPATGEVYNGLIKLCRDNISLLISGAIIGQDTQYGSRSKEQSSQDILQNLIDADQTLVEQYMNSKVLPALFKIGILPMDNLLFEYDKVEDLSELWTRTKEILPYKEVPNEWIKEKFGIEVQDRKNHPQQNLSARLFFRLTLPQHNATSLRTGARTYFEALHQSLEYQYSQCNCESCQRERLKLN